MDNAVENGTPHPIITGTHIHKGINNAAIKIEYASALHQTRHLIIASSGVDRGLINASTLPQGCSKG